MRELVRLTGVSAATIHFYAQQGLLPEAHKTAGNQATYAEETVGRIRWIRAVQTDLRMTLRGIRALLDRWGQLPLEEVRALHALGTLLDEPDPAAGSAELSAVSERLEPGDLETLRELGLVAAPGEPLSSGDLRLLDLVAGMRGAGLTEDAGFHIENIAVYRDAVERLVNDEVARIVEPVLVRHDPERLRDLVWRALPLTNQLLSLLHQRVVSGQLQRWLDIGAEDREQDTA